MNSRSNALKPLSELKEGEKAVIKKIELSSEEVKKLSDAGVGKGTALTVRNKAPLGDPIQIRIGNFFVALRKDSADKIFVISL